MRLGLDDKTPVPIDPNILSDYVGRYKFATMGTATVSTENGKLFYLMDTNKTELIPKSDSSFLHKTLPARFTFIKDKNGKVTHFILRNNLGAEVKPIDLIAKKIE